MPQPISRVPLGLLSLLDSKANGINPNGLMEDVRGVLELLPMFGLYRRQHATELLTGGAQIFTGWNGTLSAALVPAGEVWRVLHISADGTVSAGNPTLAVGFRDVSVGRSYGLSDVSTTITGIDSHVLAAWDGEMWWPPHYEADVWSNEQTAASIEFSSIRVDVLAERYKL